jgi:hypothetical protein
MQIFWCRNFFAARLLLDIPMLQMSNKFDAKLEK